MLIEVSKEKFDAAVATRADWVVEQQRYSGSCTYVEYRRELFGTTLLVEELRPDCTRAYWQAVNFDFCILPKP